MVVGSGGGLWLGVVVCVFVRVCVMLKDIEPTYQELCLYDIYELFLLLKIQCFVIPAL